jgi:signal transduction histidine kinase
MKPLDLNTLLYVIGAISFLFALLMYLFHKRIPTVKGPLQWASGSLSAVFGALLFGLYPAVPGYIAFVAAGTFTTMAIAFYLAGIRVYKGLPVNFQVLYGFVFLQFFLGNLFYVVFPMPNARMVSFSAVCVIGLLFIIREFVQPVSKPYRLAFILCSIVFGISALTSLYRMIYIVLFLPGDAHLPTNANLLFYLMTNVTQALLMGAFLLLISVKISERLELKVEAQRKFFSIIAHDLTGPVGTVTQMLELANNDKDILTEQRDALYNEVERLSESTYHLLQNLLLWSKNQLENMKPVIRKFDLNMAILENIELLRHISANKDIRIIYEPQPGLYCQADSRMIDTVIRNLISNAVKFTKTGGEIKIACEDAGMNLLVKISDNGVGMGKDVQNNLFKFNGLVTNAGTSGEKGTGLGLYLCKEFVEENNGALIVHSQENVGTEVIVSLPAG